MVNRSGRVTINFYFYLLSSFTILAFSGLIIEINYHARDLINTVTVLGMNRYEWLLIHKITAVISIIMIAIHIFSHTGWLKMIFKKRMFKGTKLNTKITVLLLMAFTTASLTGFISWLFLSNVFDTHHMVIEIHDKIGLLLSVLFFPHMVKHWPWIIRKLSRNCRQ